MGFRKKLFSKRSLQDLEQSPAKQLTLQPLLTGTADTCHEGLGCRKDRVGEVTLISGAGKETATRTQRAKVKMQLISLCPCSSTSFEHVAASHWLQVSFPNCLMPGNWHTAWSATS